MGINLALRDGKLQGAGIPIGIDENRCDITLERKSSAGPGEYTTPMLGIREAILYYSFDRDEEQKVTDQSGKGHHGSVQGAWFEAEGRIGGAMSFDGLNDYITVREVKLEKFSFSAWVKCSTSGRGVNNRRIFTMDDGLHYYALQGNLRGSLSIIFDDQEINTSVCKFEADSWKHLTLTHEAGNFKLYENGVLIQSGHLASSPVSGILCIGGRERHHGSYWQGMIDEVVLFNRALSEAGVKHLYENQLDKIEFLPRKLSVEPEIQPRPEVTGGLERFTGLWSGMAADKPEDGHSRDQLVLNLKVDEKGQLVGQAFGAFVQNGYCELKDLKVVSDQISFKVIHRTSIGMAISLRLRNVELKGEGVPIGGDKQSDRCDIILERKSAGQSAPVATGVKKKR